MSGVRHYGERPAVATLTHRVLATAASLDYVLMLVTETAGTRIPPDDARRAIRDGFARAVDDGLSLLRAVLAVHGDESRAFVRSGLRTLRSAIDAEALADVERTFAMIALASDAGG